MSNKIFGELMNAYYSNEFSNLEEVEFVFSKRHNRRMKKIFRLYEKNVRKFKKENTAEPITKVKFNRKTVMIAIMAIILALVAGCAVAMFTSNAFSGHIYSDNTELFPINPEGGKQSIEDKYYIRDYLKSSIIDSNTDINIVEDTLKNNKNIILVQYVKKYFKSHYNTEQNNFELCNVNGNEALFLDFSTGEKNWGLIVWDNKDYILEISGEASKSELIELAERIQTN